MQVHHSVSRYGHLGSKHKVPSQFDLFALVNDGNFWLTQRSFALTESFAFELLPCAWFLFPVMPQCINHVFY